MNKYVHLSLSKKDTIVKFEVVQYSTLPFITFVLDDYVPNSGAACSLYINKPDRTKIYNACSVQDNLITYEPTTQSFAVLGINEAQLHIVEPNGIAVSFLMHIEVTKNIIDESAVESQDEFTALEEALQTVSQYDTRITDNENNIAWMSPIVEDAVRHNDLDGDVNLSGDLIIKKSSPSLKLFSENTNAASSITAEEADSYGNNLVIRAGGNLIAGGGEYATSRHDATLVGTTGEHTYLGADSTVYIESNGNTIANAKTCAFKPNGNITLPSGTELRIGTAGVNPIVEFWGNSSNKIGIAISNTQENKQYEFSARENMLRLYDSTSQRTVWEVATKPVELSITRTENQYFDVTAVGRLKAWEQAGVLCLLCNLGPTISIPTSTQLFEVARISGWMAKAATLASLPAQNGSGVLLVSISSGGVIQVGNYSSQEVSTFCRGTITAIKA